MFGSEEKGCKLIGRGTEGMKEERNTKGKNGQETIRKRKSDCEFGKKE